MNFGQALEEMKAGNKVCRAGWNGKNMYLYLATGLKFETPVAIEDFEPCVVMYTAQGKHQPGWLASQADMLANDWEVFVPFHPV